MFIEDLILRVAGMGRYLFLPSISLSNSFETNFINSVALQIENGNGLTEKQASLALRILAKVERELVLALGQKTWDLTSPQYIKPFRNLSNIKTVTVNNDRSSPTIKVRFPYDDKLVKLIKDYRANKRPAPAEWHLDEKAWVFSLTEENISWINSNLLDHGFEFDQEFKEYAENIKNIENNLENFIPMVVLEDGMPKFINTFSSVPQPTDSNIVKSLFLARQYGIYVWSDEILSFLTEELTNSVTRSLITVAPTSQAIWVDKKIHNIDRFSDAVNYNDKILFVVPSGSEYQCIESWHKFLNSQGITDNQISVMFRLPNEDKGDFNIYVKHNNLNNEITENTRAVFVSMKIPKPLVKTNIKFDAIINLGYYMNTHYSMDVILASSPLLIFYTDTEPKLKRTWQQQR
jgi:hypothetical protein